MMGGRCLKITIPRRSELTPVQRLNREGVEAVKKQQYEKPRRSSTRHISMTLPILSR
jgi:hypothetical protein